MKKLFYTVCLLFPLFFGIEVAKAQDASEEILWWQRLYMPMEMGITFSSDANESSAYFVSTSLEYRFGQDMKKGLFVVAEYDEHTHGYESQLHGSQNVLEGDISYMDILLGPGWRQPISKRWMYTAMLQVGATHAGLKDVEISGPDIYLLQDRKWWLTSGKATLGLEYQCSSSFNLFLNVGYLKHFGKMQGAVNPKLRQMLDISVGFNCPLF